MKYLVKKVVIPGLAMLIALSFATPMQAEDMKSIIRRGNIVTTTYDDEATTGRYLGNGRFGTVIGAHGMNLSPDEQASRRTGASHITHLMHWGRFEFVSAIEKTPTSADYNLPVMKLHWDKVPEGISAYRQEQDFYDGTLSTSFSTEKGAVESVAWFDYKSKNIAGFRFKLKGEPLAVRTTTITDFQAYPFVFRDIVKQATAIEKNGNSYKITISCAQAVGGLSSDFYIYTSSPVEIDDQGLKVTLKKGGNRLFLSYGAPVKLSDRLFSLCRSRKAWHRTWERTGWMSFEDANAQKMWVRSMAYMLASLDDFEYGLIQPDNGFTGNPFPFHFVQDLGYIAPALMMTGHNDIVMHWVEKFAGEIPQMQAYAARLWPGSEGIYPPWELPYGPVDGYHSPTVPVAFCYEPHNSGYLCRLAKEAAEIGGDRAWAEKYAYPLIVEVCKFYKSACTREDDGLWHMAWYPCIGQDEAGGRNKTDYLCSLYSAEYSFRTAVELGLDEDGSLAAILADGLSFESLRDEQRGTYHTCRGADDFGKQKHPVQLDGISYFPIESAPLEEERNAYLLRHDITQDAHQPKFYGWTLGQFLLSGSNMKDKDGWLKDWDSLAPSDYIDPDWIQIYETSGNPLQSFYVTTHGMVEQSLIRNYVNDYWGVLDIAACPVFGGRVSFGNIDTRLGVRVSGSIEGGKKELVFKALRDCSFSYDGQNLSMKKGEIRHVGSGKVQKNDFAIVCGRNMPDTLAIPTSDLAGYIIRTIPDARVQTIDAGRDALPGGNMIVICDNDDPTIEGLKTDYGLTDSPSDWNSFRISSFHRKDDPAHIIYFLEGADIWGRQYAIYDLAERLLGVRYLKPEIDHVVEQKHFKATLVNTGIEKPDYVWRGLYPWNYNYDSRGLYSFCDINVHFERGEWDWYCSLCDWMVKNKQNAILWFDDVFAHENISGQFPDQVTDYFASRGIRQILGMGWASNEDLPTGAEWKRKICVKEDGKSIETEGWRRAICPTVPEYFQLCDTNFTRLKLTHPENYLGALIGYGENSWAAWEKGVDCVRHRGVKSSDLMLRDLSYLKGKFADAGFGDLPLGFVTSTHSIHPGNPFETDNFIYSLPPNSIFTMHTYQQSAWTQFSALYDKIAERNDNEGTQLKVFHIAEVAFLCGADIPLLKPSILRRRNEHFNTIPKENTIGHLATLNTTQYAYWYNTYQLMKWQWHKDDRNWDEVNFDNFKAIFGEKYASRLNEIFNRLCCLEYVLPYSRLDSLRNTAADLRPPRQWGRYNPKTHPNDYGFLLWADETDVDKLDDAQASIEAVLEANEELSGMQDSLYRREFYNTIRLTAAYYGIRACTGKYKALQDSNPVEAGAELQKAKEYLSIYDENLEILKKRNPLYDGRHDRSGDLVFNPKSEYFDNK